MILEWVQIAVEEERVSVLPCACLEGEGDEIAESSRRHSVLRWEEAVVGGEADFRTPVYCFGENDETELAGELGLPRFRRHGVYAAVVSSLMRACCSSNAAGLR